ncbi:MAG: tape measure protein [Burkholderiaceae bacterium]
MSDNLRFQLDLDTTAAVGSINEFFNTFANGAAQAKSKLNSAFGQGIKTEVKVEFKNGELVAKQVQSINQESKRLGDIFDAVNGKVRQTPNELSKQIAILRQLRGDTEKYESGTRKITSEWVALTRKIQEAKNALNDINKGNVFQQLASAVQGLAGRFALVQTLANGLQGALQGIVRGASEFVATGERVNLLTRELTAFTGSTANAKKLFQEFQQVAAGTKFNVEQVASAGKILLAYGLNAGDAADATRRLSIIASATNSDVQLLARNLGQVASQGQAYTRDLQQFAIAGIPIWDELARVTGKSVAEVKQLAQEGRIGFTEVKQALENLTAEGSAFARISEDIKSTFTGALREVESSLTTLAFQFVATAQGVDKAFGAPVINSIKLLATVINALAANWQAITSIIVGASVAVGVFLAISNFGTIVTVIQGLITAYNAWRASISAAAIAQAVLQGLLGNWGAVAAGLAAGTIVAVALNQALQQQGIEAENAASGATNLQQKINELTAAELELAEAAGQGNLVKKYEEAIKKQDEYKKALDDEREKLKALAEEVNNRFEAEKTAIKDKVNATKEALSEEKTALADLKEQIKGRYEDEKSRLDENLQKVRDYYDEQIGALEKLGPAEEKLQQYRKQEIQDKLTSGGLSEKERLELEAQLERMDRQEKIRELRLQKEGEVLDIQKKQSANEEDYKKQIEAVTEAANKRIDALEETLKSQETELKAVTEAQAQYNEKVNAALESGQKLSGNIQDLITKTETQAARVYEAAAAFDAQAASASNLAEQIRDVAAAQRELNAARSNGGGGGGGAPKASGGPVSGGTTYTVNELGKEAFLSASGKLSMINAPSWGQWRAPGAGTVIPAHLTSKLDIPAGGININSAAKAATAKAGSGANGSARLLKAISGIAGAGNVVNNVSIQSENPTKTASDMMVELTKIRRRRYS